MSSKQGLYDIQGYTDNELYDILDLVNPSDRELEAKILMEIHKYENINTKSARKLAIFFDEIYNHFFETEDDVVEGFESDGDGEYASGGLVPAGRRPESHRAAPGQARLSRCLRRAARRIAFGTPRSRHGRRCTWCHSG